MKKTATSRKLIPFDAARYLDDDEAVAEYMSAVFEADDPDLLLLALSDVARAKGMAQVAKDAGLGRESLYKALTPGAKPRFDTVLKVAKALGVRFTAHPVSGMPTKRSNPTLKRTRTGLRPTRAA
jgi:probable addiction module antidote protein